MYKIIYLFNAFIYYLVLLLEFFDYAELKAMVIIMISLTVFIIIYKDFRVKTLEAIKSIIKLFFNPISIFTFSTVILYFTYILIYFEEKINLIFIVFVIQSFIKDYFLSYLDITSKSSWDNIKNFSYPVILLTFNQLVLSIHNNNFNNINTILLSLMFIPIFSSIILFIKFYIHFIENIRNWNRNLKLSNYDLLKLFTYALIYTMSFNKIRILDKIIHLNKNYDESKALLLNMMKKEKYKRNRKKIKNKKRHLTKNQKIFLFIWFCNVVLIIYNIINKQQNDVNYDFFHHYTIIILYIYFWIDLMKIKNIENQYDFVIYSFINIFIIIILIKYTSTLNSNRFIDLSFLIPIFIFTKLFTLKKRFPNLLKMPFLTEKNFFNLSPLDYDSR